MKQLLFSILLLSTLPAFCQVDTSVAGIYSDGITRLELKGDGHFNLYTPDNVFTYTYKNYQSSGAWTCENNIVLLNPGKTKRTPELLLEEKTIAGADSVEIHINYITAEYENEVLVRKETADPHMITLYINNNRNYLNLVHTRRRRICAFAPKIKKQYITDSSNTVKLPLQRIDQLGMYTYGFDAEQVLVPRNKTSNYFEITIVQPVDADRAPRNKTVIIKNNKAYFYEHNGAVVTSGMLTPLKKM